MRGSDYKTISVLLSVCLSVCPLLHHVFLISNVCAVLCNLLIWIRYNQIIEIYDLSCPLSVQLFGTPNNV